MTHSRCSKWRTCTSNSTRTAAPCTRCAASSFTVEAGETLAIVGESGCGKSVTVQSIMGLIPMPPGRITAGHARLRGHDILRSKQIDGADIRGAEIGMIFQDPMTSLNPTMTIGDQIAETLIVHRGFTQPAGAPIAQSNCSTQRAFRTPPNARRSIRSNFPAACCNGR